MALNLGEDSTGVMGRIASRIGIMSREEVPPGMTVAPLRNTAPPAAAPASARR